MKLNVTCVQKKSDWSQMDNTNIVTVKLMVDSPNQFGGSLEMSGVESEMALFKSGSKYVVNIVKDI